jgi:hypothetical protein
MEIVTDELSIYTDVSMFRSGRTLTIHQEYYIHTQGSIRMGPVGFAADTYTGYSNNHLFISPLA